METHFLWGIIAGAIIVLVAFLIPVLLQLKKTVKAAEEFLQSTQESLNPLLKGLQETVEKTNQVAEKLDESIGNVQHLTKAVGETGELIDDINSLTRQVAQSISVSTSSFGVALKTALSVLTQGLKKKEVAK